MLLVSVTNTVSNLVVSVDSSTAADTKRLVINLNNDSAVIRYRMGLLLYNG